ncbi:MAG TPA: carbonic anhydrase [Solirubrobacteraceae bacterium]|jgi:carbonic anhydrase|nr:carbonic anhydrase [Solirubrobacteraceae bacterium]
MTAADEMLAHAEAHSADQAAGDLGIGPRRGVAVLSCMDARIDVLPLLGLARGDAHVIRNAGGLVTDDALRSLAASQRLLGTEEVVVVMHEGCGLCGASDDDFAATLAAEGVAPAWRLGGFADLDEALRASLARLRAAPELPAREQVRGFVFDPASGSLRDVER